MSETSDVAVIGGGVAACSVAYFLAAAGVKATLIEREGVGSQASGFSAGGLNPMQRAGSPGHLGPLAIESFRMHGTMWERLSGESGVDFASKTVSMVKVAFQESELPELRETEELYEAADGFSAEWVDGQGLRELEPRIAGDATTGLLTRGNAVLDSLAFTLALSRAAQSAGARVHIGEARGLASTGRRVDKVRLGDGEIACDAVVVAMGPWSADAGRWLGIPMPIEPVKGEILRMNLPGRALDHDLTSGDVSLFSRSDGLVWVGTSEERRGFDREPSEAVRSRLMNDAVRLMPDMAEAELVMHTACLRPVAVDGLPIIGKAPGWDNVYLATGAGKKGILIAPGIGKAIADLITEGSTALPIGPFSPARFAASVA